MSSTDTNDASRRWPELSAAIHRASRYLSSDTLSEARKTQLVDQLDALGVLKNLDLQQRDDLALFVFDVSTVLESTPDKKWIREERKTSQQLRMLNRKKGKLRTALEELTAYWISIGGPTTESLWDESRGPTGNVYLIENLAFLTSIPHALEAIKEEIDSLAFPTDFGRHTLDRPVLDKRVIAIALDDLFVAQCRRSRRESEIRVAKIGNHFWKWDVAVREKGKDDKWRGSEAIRKLLKRHSPRRP